MLQYAQYLTCQASTAAGASVYGNAGVDAFVEELAHGARQSTGSRCTLANVELGAVTRVHSQLYHARRTQFCAS